MPSLRKKSDFNGSTYQSYIVGRIPRDELIEVNGQDVFCGKVRSYIGLQKLM